MNTTTATQVPCPCGSGMSDDSCCQRFLSGRATADSPEALMRSRYSAFALQNVDYLVMSHAQESRSTDLRRELELSMGSVSWLALHILAKQDAPFDAAGAWVEFVAFYQQETDIHQLHEKSIFVFRDQCWFYLKGQILPERVWQRNEQCWCRSGKKTKKCHGN